MRERLLGWLRPATLLATNGWTLAGAVITTSAAVTQLVFWAFETARGGHPNPYAGILFFLVLPGFFVLGLLLVPAGILIERRRARAAGAPPPAPVTGESLRRAAGLAAALTVVNVALLGTASYRAVTFMDSTTFCGATCHTVMAPEFSAYANSAHARVACVECHIGPGAPWFVRSKLSGVRQVFAVTLKTYSRPIPSPVKHLRPARETCEECHWPQKFHGDKFLVSTKYSDDASNTPATSVMVLKVGGSNASGHSGIHGRHLDPRVRIRYVTSDAKRQVIPKVSVVGEDGKVVDYVSSELPSTPEALAAGETRDMDCLDCHNRPSHAFALPERAVDRAIAEGAVSRELPFAKRKAVELLRREYPQDTGPQRIAEGFTEYYRSEHPQAYKEHRAQVEAAARQIGAIYARNVFPEMKVTWGTYPNNIGHDDFLGCFRCHDEKHRASDGRTLGQDCNACHTLLAMEEERPKILDELEID